MTLFLKLELELFLVLSTFHNPTVEEFCSKNYSSKNLYFGPHSTQQVLDKQKYVLIYKILIERNYEPFLIILSNLSSTKLNFDCFLMKSCLNLTK